MALKPNYDIHRKQHFVSDWETDEFLDFLEGEGFRHATGGRGATLSARPQGFLCIDMEARTLCPMCGISHCAGSLVMKPEDFREIYAILKTGEEAR